MYVFIVIPGNPGSSLLYSDFVSILRRKIDYMICDVFVIDHIVDAKKNTSLSEQIVNVQDKLSEIVDSRDPVDSIYVIAHSIGAYMAFHAIKNIGLSRVKKVFCLFPFFQADFSVPRARSLRMICKYHKTIGMIGGVLSMFPHYLIKCVIQFFAKDVLSEHILETCLKLMVRENVDQYFYLGSQLIVEKEFDWNTLLNAPYDLTIFACPNDTWMSPKVYDRICSLFPDKVVWCENMTHGFISTEDCTRRAVDLICDYLRE
jgi:hypothetical protein